jgi:subtilisin-like proprotein convertase family protein
VPIPDVGTVTSTITVSGVDPYLWDLNLQTFLVHSDNGQLHLQLRSPQGTVMDLSFENGIGDADVFNGTIWDDSAGVTNPPGPASLATYVTNVVNSPLEPDGSLGMFYGENPNGVWTMILTDILPGHTGTLNSWKMEVTTLPAAPGIAEATGSNPATVAIPDDNTPVTSTIDMSPPFTSVCAVKAKTNLQHQANGDIVMTLTSPAGTVSTLTDKNGKFYSNLFNGTVWDDKAPDPVQDHFYTDGLAVPALQPEETMSAFTGENPTGTWTLSIRDAVTGNTGSLFGWDLTVESCTCDAASATAPLRVDAHNGSGASGNNGVFEPDETVQVETTWTNPSASSFSLTGAATNFTGPAGPAYNIVDGAANFGTVNSLATANCFDATADCYSLQVTGARPVQHWDTTFDETVTPSTSAPPTTKTWTLHIGGSFNDVPTSNLFYAYIENIFHNGVTGGCSPTDYCPSGTALRKQMAVFVLKAKDGANYQPPPATGIFLDVPASNPFAPWIEELYNRGVVAGCGAGPTYCPDNPVLRQQMAVFLLRTLEGSTYVPPACTGVFLDVPCPGQFSDWIEDLAARGIAAGCGGNNFCPTNPNTRGQMAPFLVKTFGLILYGP